MNAVAKNKKSLARGVLFFISISFFSMNSEANDKGLLSSKNTGGSKSEQNNSTEADRDFSNQLDQMETKERLKVDLFEKATSATTAAELVAALDWLKERVFKQSCGARYAYAYAVDLWQAGIKDSAALMFIYAKLLIRIDAARCADKSAPNDKIIGWESKLTPIQKYFDSLNKKTKLKFVTTVLDLENGKKHREHDEWLCGGGIDYFLKYNEKYGNLNGAEAKADKRSGTKKTVLEDDAIKPDYIADSEWQEARRLVIVDFKKEAL